MVGSGWFERTSSNENADERDEPTNSFDEHDNKHNDGVLQYDKISTDSEIKLTRVRSVTQSVTKDKTYSGNRASCTSSSTQKSHQ